MSGAIRVGRACKATIRINGYNYLCDYGAPHPGIGHQNETAQAVWCSDGEARKHQGTKP